MKIKSPLSAKNEVIPLCDAGADEFFCGIEPREWGKKYRDLCINQRAIECNFRNLRDLEIAVAAAHKRKAKVHLAMNAFFNSDGQYKLIREIIKGAVEAGVDGIIVAEPSLLSSVSRILPKGVTLVAGTDSVVFNSASAYFFKNLGAKRIVFSRAMKLEEMQEIISGDSSLEYEAFIIHDLCFFEDGFCAFCKEQSGSSSVPRGRLKNIKIVSSTRTSQRGYGGGCRSGFIKKRMLVADNRLIREEKPYFFWPKKHIQGCGACALYDLRRIGVSAVKILDRTLSLKEKIRATRFISKSMVNLDRTLSREEYFRKCRELFKKTFKITCSRFDCYYPEGSFNGKCNPYHRA